MKKIILSCTLILLVSLLFISQTSAHDCETGESFSTDKTAYKENVAQIKEI